MITLVPGAVVVDGSGLGVRLGASVDQRVGTQAIVGNPQPRLVGLREAPQAVGPLLQTPSVRQVAVQVIGRAIYILLDGAVRAEHLIVRVYRPHHVHDDRCRLFAW
ncbi:Uncharacterised protein [Mycobacteroides abscessus subsp. abscessus]|nr:Uncharacterised protein [Mycobacteroides abscessus subsp. abscessus]